MTNAAEAGRRCEKGGGGEGKYESASSVNGRKPIRRRREIERRCLVVREFYRVYICGALRACISMLRRGLLGPPLYKSARDATARPFIQLAFNPKSGLRLSQIEEKSISSRSPPRIIFNVARNRRISRRTFLTRASFYIYLLLPLYASAANACLPADILNVYVYTLLCSNVINCVTLLL